MSVLCVRAQMYTFSFYNLITCIELAVQVCGCRVLGVGVQVAPMCTSQLWGLWAGGEGCVQGHEWLGAQRAPFRER